MTTPGIVLCQIDRGCRERLIRGLKTMRLAARLVPVAVEDLFARAEDPDNILVLAGLAGPADPVLKLLASLKKARPSLSILAVVPKAAEDPGLRLMREGRVDGAIAEEDETGLLSLVRSEWRRVENEALAEARFRALHRVQAEQARSQRRTSELEEIYDSTLENLMTALDLRDVETFGHSQAVAKYTQVLAGLIGLSDPAELDDLRRGALLHDIGKIAIPDAILKKPGALTADEWNKIRLHPALGFGLVKEIKLVRIVGDIILHHHERFDGAGYPHGLKGDRIPLEARLFALADALDAITAHRPYRRARDFRAAQKEIIRHAGTQFDPRLVEAFLRLKPEKWEKIRFETTAYVPGIEEFSILARKLKS
ncbi:MAG: HD domain-containing protein [Acidobacteriota bacterium]|nr:HD domain-containing protein [Acidobacteriota bacterium]